MKCKTNKNLKCIKVIITKFNLKDKKYKNKIILSKYRVMKSLCDGEVCAKRLKVEYALSM